MWLCRSSRLLTLFSLSFLLLLSISPVLAADEEEHLQNEEQTGILEEERFYLPGASGSGPFEAVKDWIAAFEAKYPEADLSVSSTGSGAAQSALWGEIDCVKKPVEGLCAAEGGDEGAVTVSSGPTSTLWGMGGGTIDGEAYAEHEERGLQQLPALGGPIMLTYSKDVTGDLGSLTSKQLNLSFDTIAGIFNNTILHWNDTAIQADNPDLELPSERITVVIRSDKSGMSQTLTEAIHHANPDTWPEDGVGKKPDWPLNNLTYATESSGMCVVGDDDDLSLNLKADGQTGIGISLLRRPYSIGYLELGYFSTLTQFVGQAYVSSPAHPTSFVPATVETLKTTMGGLADQLEPDILSLTLVDQDTPLGGYPISRYVFWYIKKDAREYENCYQAWLVYKFIEWTYTDPLAEEIALGHGWVVPPASVVDKALAKLQEMKCVDDDDNVGDSQHVFVADYIPLPYQEAELEEPSNLVQVLVPTVVCTLLILAAIAVYVYIDHKRQQEDSVWNINISELDFGSNPEVIGKGGFGLVVLAEYRGTKVAVKRVIPRPENSGGGGGGDSTNKTENDFCYYDTERCCDGATFNPGLWSVGIHKSLMLSDSLPATQSNCCYGGRDGDNTNTRKKELDKKLKADFIAEMRQLAKLRHPNITTTMGAVLAPGQEPMLVMEHMQNGSLYEAIRNDTINLNSQEDILTIIQDIAHGLRFLHAANPQVIHGDLKTKNVLIDSNFRAKVCDFGLSNKTEAGSRGTPYWMAPELLDGSSSNTTKSDIYAFGILLYEVYARKNPYEGEEYAEVLRLVCDPTVCKRPPVPALCPPNMAALMKDCLQGSPHDRPTAKEIDLTLQAEGTVQGRVFRIEALNRNLVETNKKISSEQATQLGHFACMSHEIRTPLNCIIGVSSLLEADEGLDMSQMDSVKMIMSSGKLLKQVVNDVLDFSKFVSGKGEINIERTNLQETLGTIMTSMQLSPITERREITLRTFYDPLIPQHIETDSRRLQQILYNLLSNAVKFSKLGGNVDLTVSVVEVGSSGNQIRLDVTDYGKGIHKSEFDKLFQPFAQTETGIKSSEGGTGLGLAITKQLSELLGGSISVDSRINEWTKFSVQFPLTVSLVDKQSITKRMVNNCVWLVSDKDMETQYVTQACEEFNVDQLHFKSVEELDANSKVPGMGSSCVCLVQESLCNETFYESISKRPKTIVVTFGPEGKFDKGQVHYKSPSQVFPSVFMQELGSLCEYASLSSRLAPPTPEPTPQISFEGLKIMVAEDNKVNQKVMLRLLERLGVTDVKVAANGKIAVDMEAEETFDIIFMDMQMPEMDGLQACKLIVARSDDSSAPKIVFLSAHAADDVKVICIEHGATDYLAKPCSLGDLRKKLETLVSD